MQIPTNILSAILSTVLLLRTAQSLAINDNKNGEWVAKLLTNSPDDYVLVAMGDPQFWHVCEVADVACKNQSQAFRDEYHADTDCKIDKDYAAQQGWDDAKCELLKQTCRKIESNWANIHQQAVIKGLMDLLAPAQQPRGLVIAGDLTNYGKQEELDIFKRIWVDPFTVPLYPGLGNKDYEENYPKCGDDSCNDRMLRWLINYSETHNISIDYERVPAVEGDDETYIGSFATSVESCNVKGKQCSKIIDVNDYADFANSFTWGNTSWIIKSSKNFLQSELTKAKASGANVFVVTHQISPSNIIKKAIKDTGMNNRVFVLHAHKHEKHKVADKCAGIEVPFIFCGSVPNNRFTVIKLLASSAGTAEIYLMSSNADYSATIVDYIVETFAKC